MSKVSEIKADKRFPAFITNHAIFSSGLEVKKIFSEIGLENFSEKVHIENSSEITDAAAEVILFIRTEVGNRINSLTRYAEIKTAPAAGKPVKGFGTTRQGKYKKCSAVLKKFKLLLSKPFKTFIIINEKTNKITLNLSEDIVDEEKKVVFKKGEGLFKVYQKINELLRAAHFLPLSQLDHSPAFKKYNNANIPASESRIVFASTGVEGAWDIATMSMRGIHSCQSWGQGNATHLVGSIVDPCTAIMYLTSGSNHEGKGTKMMRRCIVRFIIDENNKPSLILERMYPSHNKDVAEKFVTLLKHRTQNKYPIVNCSLVFRNGVTRSYVPLTPILAKLCANSQPYRDSAVEFKVLISNRAAFIENLKRQIEAVPDNYAHRARVAAGKIKLADLGNNATEKLFWKHARGENSAVYSIATETAFLIRTSMNEALKNIKDTNVKLPVIALEVFDSIFTPSSAETIIDNVIELFAKRSKRKPSDFYKGLMKTHIKEALSKEIEKDRNKLVAKVEKIKGDKTLPLPSDDVIELVAKVS